MLALMLLQDARRDARLDDLGDLVTLEERTAGRRVPGALSHDVIHGLDITVHLGIDRRVPEETVRLVLGGVSPRSVKFFGVDLGGIQLRADDLDRTFGSGTSLQGSAQDLLLVLCGRTLPAGRLHGEPSQRFTYS